MDTNENKKALPDEEMENVSGGIDMAAYETIMKMSKECNYTPDWMRQMVKDEEDYLTKNCGFIKSTCAKCGKTFLHKPHDDKKYCDLCLALRG